MYSVLWRGNLRLILHNFLCYFNPLRRVGFACLAGWKIKKRKQSKRDQTEGGQLRACIIFGSLVLGETQWGERVKLEWRFLKITFGSSGGGCSSHSLIPLISFRLLEGWPPGLGKGEISGEWRRQAKLATGSFQPAWAQSSSDRVPGEVTQVLWLTPEDWLVRFRCRQKDKRRVSPERFHGQLHL